MNFWCGGWRGCNDEKVQGLRSSGGFREVVASGRESGSTLFLAGISRSRLGLDPLFPCSPPSPYSAKQPRPSKKLQPTIPFFSRSSPPRAATELPRSSHIHHNHQYIDPKDRNYDKSDSSEKKKKLSPFELYPVKVEQSLRGGKIATTQEGRQDPQPHRPSNAQSQITPTLPCPSPS